MRQTGSRSFSSARSCNRFRGRGSGFNFKTQLFVLVAQTFQSIAVNEQDYHDANDGNPANQQNSAHPGSEAGIFSAQDHRLRVLRAPNAIRQINEWDIEKCKDAKNSGKRGATLRIFEQATQQEIRNIEQPEDERAGEARVPGPPDTPDRAGPDRAGDQHNRAAGNSYFPAGDPKPVPLGMASNEIGGVSDEDYEEGDEGGDGAGHVEIENALDSVHGPFIRCNEERGIARAENQGGDGEYQCDAALHWL